MCGMANVPDLPEQKPVQPPALRASDADRERVAEILRTAAPEVELRMFAFMGGIDITVPEDAEVIINGVGVMGGFDHRAAGPGEHGSVRIKVTGLAFWGGVSVKRLPPKEEVARRKEQRKLERRQARERRRLER